MLEERFTEPSGWHWATITPRHDQYLRYGWIAPAGARALAVVFPGLSEYCEKYFEVARDLMARGFAVAVIDWRGQGNSWRHLPDREKRHHDDFALDVEDAMAFLRALDSTGTLKTVPRILLGHSMGGHIGLRLMRLQLRAFRCAVLTAPMLGINLPGDIESPSRAIATGAVAMGLGERYVPGGMAWSETNFHNNIKLLTSDPARRDMQLRWMKERPDLRSGGLTFGWLAAALNSTRLTRDPAWLSGVEAPCLLVKSGREMIVSNRAIDLGVRALPQAELLEITGALHEAMMEHDRFRAQFFAGFDAFVAKHPARG